MSTTIGGVRIVDMPDLGTFTSASSIVGERSGSGRFSATGLGGYFLPLSGGTVTGATMFTQGISPGVPPAVSPVNSLSAAHYASGAATTLVAMSSNTAVSAITTPAARGACPVIANISAAIKMVPPGGVPVGSQLQEQWAYISQNYDCSNLPSSVGGAMLNEHDNAANGADDAGPRAGAVYVFNTLWPIGGPPGAINPVYGPPPSVGGLPAEFGGGLVLTAQSDTVLKRGIVPAVPYSTSLIECRLATQLTGTIQTTVAAGGTSLHVSNVVSYLSWGSSGSPVSSGNPMPVTIGANTYSVIGAAFDAPVGGVTTNKGVITLSSGIIGTDGAAGNSVKAHTRAIWLADGQEVAFSTDGGEYINGGGGALFIHANNFVEFTGAGEVNVDGSLNVGADLTVDGKLVLGNPGTPSTASQYFHTSGHTGPDVSIIGAVGTGANDGTLTITAGRVTINAALTIALPINAANDAAAAGAGIVVGGVYRNGSVLQVRVA